MLNYEEPNYTTCKSNKIKTTQRTQVKIDIRAYFVEVERVVVSNSRKTTSSRVQQRQNIIIRIIVIVHIYALKLVILFVDLLLTIATL